MTYKVGELMAGIGGFSVGLEATGGFETVWQVELDSRLREDVLGRWWPDVPKFGDIREVGAHNLERVDVLTAGFPCQPVSQAGRRRGRADPRWLWPEVARVVRELRPRYVLLENVDALLRPYRCPEECDGYLPALVEDVAADLAEMGYLGEWASVRASDIGAPHERERVWVIAQLADAPFIGGQQLEQRVGGERPHADRPNGLPREPRGGGGPGDPPQLAHSYSERRVHGEPQEHPAEAGLNALGHAAPGGTADLANTDSGGRPLKRFGAESDPRHHADGRGEGEVLADAEGERGQVRTTQRERQGRPTGSGTELDHADDGRREQRDAGERQPNLPGEAGARRNGAGRGAQPRLGRDSDGLSRWMDGWPGWPAHRGEAQHDYEPPRLTEEKGRVKRLHALGNALVPHIPYALGLAILAHEAEQAA